MNRAQSDLLRRLASHGGWMDRAALVHNLGWSEARMDDELADLVAAGAVMWNERARQYRLAGATMARAAARQLLNQKDRERRRVVLARPDKTGAMAVGIARLHGDVLLMGELTVECPRGDLQALERVTHAVLKLAVVDEA
jgi:hypothetical protein